MISLRPWRRPGSSLRPSRNDSPYSRSRRSRPGVFAAAPVKIDATYTTPAQSHAMMEPHATLAVWERRRADALHLQSDAAARDRLGRLVRWRFRKEKVRLISRYVGGGFAPSSRSRLTRFRRARRQDGQPARRARADAPASVSRHHPPDRHDPEGQTCCWERDGLWLWTAAIDVTARGRTTRRASGFYETAANA